MFPTSLVIFAILFACAKSSAPDYSRFIKLAYGVSQAAYLPYSTREFIQDGYIMRSEGNRACSVGGWEAVGQIIRGVEVVVFWHQRKRLALFGFRGTDSIKDWINNLKILLKKVVPYDFRLHRGFYDRYRKIQGWFEGEYKKLRDENYKIIITGHSLGGAMATISAALVASNTITPPDAVITFASPKVGNRKFREFYHKIVGCQHHTTNIEIGCDIVVKVPFFPYTHVCKGETIRIGPFHGILECHRLAKGYLKGLQQKYGENLEGVNQECDN